MTDRPRVAPATAPADAAAGDTEPLARPRLLARAASPPRRRGAECYDTLLWRLAPGGEVGCRGFVVAVTGSERRAGASTVAANLAIRAADQRVAPVLLIDANLKRPAVERAFRLYDAAGLAEVLAELCDPTEAVYESGVDGLSVMPAGSRSLAERLLVGPGRPGRLIGELRGDFRTIVLDLPEAHDLTHAVLLAQRADAAVLAVRCHSGSRKRAADAAAQLVADGVPVAGSVLTQHRRFTPDWLRRWL